MTAAKHCCIGDCYSSSLRPEDNGVTYHKYPRNKNLCQLWLEVTQHNDLPLETPLYVCSRHFRKSDFQVFKDSKFKLRSDAVPSIFPWTVTNTTMEDSKIDNSQIEENPPQSTHQKDEDVKKSDSPKDLELQVTVDVDNDQDQGVICLNDNQEPEENLEAIKKFIAKQEKEILQLESEYKPVIPKTASKSNILDNATAKIIGCTNVAGTSNEMMPELANVTKIKKEVEDPSELLLDSKTSSEDITSNVMGVILSEAVTSTTTPNVKKTIKKPKENVFSPGEKGGSMALLSVGSKVEAKDFSELWYPAKIVEVDYDENEVLVQYDNVSKKHDEWISVSSPRLRPIGSGPSETVQDTSISSLFDNIPVKEEPKSTDKTKVKFQVGDRCLARWRDNRRFTATICAELDNGDYEIMFDDGFRWTCGTNRLYRMKQTSDSTIKPSDSTTSPQIGPTTDLPPGFPYHTHLFDPSRDYLGTKSERREKKRKLNIKEIFNIGQKKKKVDDGVKRPRIIRKKATPAPSVTPVAPPVDTSLVTKQEIIEEEVKQEIPVAVASIIGTEKQELSETMKEVKLEIKKIDINNLSYTKVVQPTENEDVKVPIVDATSATVPDDAPTVKHEEVIDKLKDVLYKSQETKDFKPEGAIVIEVDPNADTNDASVSPQQTPTKKHKDPTKRLSKIKKAKKMRLMREMKVSKEVEKVRSELERVKRQVEEMKKQVRSTEEFYGSDHNKRPPPLPMPDSCLGPGEWCAKWVNGQPLGTVSELEPSKDDKGGLPRRSVQVEDNRLPPGWTKHMVRRSLGSSAGKWDVVLISPDNKRFHTKTDMRHHLESLGDPELTAYEHVLYDFGVHRKLAKRLGWDQYNDTGEQTPVIHLPVGTLHSTSPLVKSKKLSLKRKDVKVPKRKKRKSMQEYTTTVIPVDPEVPGDDVPFDCAALEEGYVYVGALKVQILENLLRCPADGCYKNFRNNTLLKMHIKHYHRELKKMLGATPKVEELASARSKVPKLHEVEQKTPKIKIARIPKRTEEPKPIIEDFQTSVPPPSTEVTPTIPPKLERLIPRSQDSPRLRKALLNKPAKRPKVLLPVRRPDDDMPKSEPETTEENTTVPETSIINKQLDFESSIATHTVTKPIVQEKKLGEKKRKSFANLVKDPSEDEEYLGGASDFETRSSFPRSGSPDKYMDTMPQAVSSESNEEIKQQQFMFSESGEKIKIVHMKREEIINCHCGFREEDGLMIQCELCLCWQHALCHNIQKESEVPEKYTCSICLNPRRGRRGKRFLHDQDRLLEGVLPGAAPAAAAAAALKRAHELSGNLILMDEALHATRIKIYVASHKNHPKLYLWSKDWESPEANLSQDKLSQDYLHLSSMISDIGKENLPLKDDLKDLSLGDIRSPSSDDPSFGQGTLGSGLLSGLLSSPSGPLLDLPIASELERLSKSVQEGGETGESCSQPGAGVVTVSARGPQAEAPVEAGACRARLLAHVARAHQAVDKRLDSIEAQIAELESQDPSFDDDETADFFPRTKQTIQMLLRDLDTMEELGAIT